MKYERDAWIGKEFSSLLVRWVGPYITVRLIWGQVIYTSVHLKYVKGSEQFDLL